MLSRIRPDKNKNKFNNKPAGGQSRRRTIRSAFCNGPLGPGAFKVVQVVTATGWRRLPKREWPAVRLFGGAYPGSARVEHPGGNRDRRQPCAAGVVSHRRQHGNPRGGGPDGFPDPGSRPLGAPGTAPLRIPRCDQRRVRRNRLSMVPAVGIFGVPARRRRRPTPPPPPPPPRRWFREEHSIRSLSSVGCQRRPGRPVRNPALSRHPERVRGCVPDLRVRMDHGSPFGGRRRWGALSSRRRPRDLRLLLPVFERGARKGAARRQRRAPKNILVVVVSG